MKGGNRLSFNRAFMYAKGGGRVKCKVCKTLIMLVPFVLEMDQSQVRKNSHLFIYLAKV